MNRNLISILLVVWMLVLSLTMAYVIKTEHGFIEFMDVILYDNLKNVIVSEGKTFLIAEMDEVDIGRPDLPIKLYGPVYMDADEMEKVTQWKRNMTMMVHEWEQMDFESRIQMAKTNTWFLGRLEKAQARKEKQK